MNPVDLTLCAARNALLSGDMSCLEYVRALLHRSSQARTLNAWVTRDEPALLRAAAAVDASGVARDSALPLAGIPIALKDNFDTLALPTTGGTRALQHCRPPTNAPVVQALFDAGALLAGKTNLHELSLGVTCNNAFTGAARNPWNPLMIPGGSSGGSAVAVAARMVPAALGTDTGASVRLPAALCGIVGLRPTTGRYSSAGIVPLSRSRDTAGPMARCVQDVALLDSVMCGVATGLTPAPLRGLRLGVPRADFYGSAEPAVLRVLDAALRELAAQGVVLIEADVPALPMLCAAIGPAVTLHEFKQDLAKYLQDRAYEITLADVAAQIRSQDVARIVTTSLANPGMSGGLYEEAMRQRSRLQAAYADYFRRHRIDAMVFPTALLAARSIGDDETVELNGQCQPTFATYIRNTGPGSHAGIPGISLPAGLTPEGLPVGLELDGPMGRDRHLLAMAAAVESVLPQMQAPLAWADQA